MCTLLKEHFREGDMFRCINWGDRILLDQLKVAKTRNLLFF